MTQSRSRKIFRLIRKTLYYLIPPAILVFIFMKIDLNSFITSLKNINLKYFVLGLAFYPLIISVGAFRWYYLKKKMIKRDIPVSFSINNYWIGLSVGFLAPGSIGWDIYRIIAATRKYGSVVKNTFVAVTEKLLGLTVCCMIIIVAFPFLDVSSNDIIHRIMVFSYIIFFSLVFFVAIGGLFSRKLEFMSKIANRVQRSLLEKLKNTRFKFSQFIRENGEDQEIKYNFRKFLPSLPVSLVLSVLIQLIASLAIYIIIKSLNYDLPYYVPLFISPVMTFIFLLPISFGSIGIREGSFIFFYGIFGMDQEAALLLSFLTLSGAFLNVLIGAVVMQVSSVRRILA